jgi:hypothetical protein
MTAAGFDLSALPFLFVCVHDSGSGDHDPSIERLADSAGTCVDLWKGEIEASAIVAHIQKEAKPFDASWVKAFTTEEALWEMISVRPSFGGLASAAHICRARDGASLPARLPYRRRTVRRS